MKVLFFFPVIRLISYGFSVIFYDIYFGFFSLLDCEELKRLLLLLPVFYYSFRFHTIIFFKYIILNIIRNKYNYFLFLWVNSK